MAALLLAGIAGIVGGCAGSSGDEAAPPATTATPRGPVLQVCTDAPYEVFEFGDPSDLQGFDVDLAEQVGGRLDRPVRFVVTPLDQFEVALSNGTCELVSSALPVPSSPTGGLAYSAPYLLIDQALAVRADTAAVIPDPAATSGRTVGVVDGSSGADLAPTLLPADATVVAYPTWTELEGALRAGTVDAALGDGPLADRAALVDGGLTVVARQPGDVAYALAAAPSSTELLAAVDAALAELAADGTIDHLRTTWFGR